MEDDEGRRRLIDEGFYTNNDSVLNMGAYPIFIAPSHEIRIPILYQLRQSNSSHIS